MEKIGKSDSLTNIDSSASANNEKSARKGAMILIEKYTNGELSKGEYAHELVSSAYINLVSQAQSGRALYVEGQPLDIKLGGQIRIPNTDMFLNGFRLGKISVNYYQSRPTVGDFYNPEATIIITNGGSLIKEQMDNPELPYGTEVYNGTFKDINSEGLAILEMCVKFSALNFDLYVDKGLMRQFREIIPQILNQLGDPDNEMVPLLEDGGFDKK